MYYLVKLGWGKKTKGVYSSECYAGVKDEFNGTYHVFGVQYENRPGAQWWLKSGSIWQMKNPDGEITRVNKKGCKADKLKRGNEVIFHHRTIRTLEKRVRAIVLSVHPTSPPERLTSPLARLSPREKDRF